MSIFEVKFVVKQVTRLENSTNCTIMEETNSVTIISVECFDTVCRICLLDLKQKKQININDYLYQNKEKNLPEKEELIIKEILSRYASIKVIKHLLVSYLNLLRYSYNY